jgi:plasmid stabilization system protein ParE
MTEPEWTLVWTTRALRELDREAVWWAANRPKAPDLFEREIAETTEAIRAAPGIGQPYREGIRRAVLPRTQRLIFYTTDDQARVVSILCLWSSQRGRAPRLRP